MTRRRPISMRTAILVLACFSGATLWAQPRTVLEEQQRVRQYLASPQWSDKAWGVYFAGRLHTDALKSEIQEQFRWAASLASSGYGSPEWGFVASLFDAAIQSNITVPASVLQSFETYWADPMLVLLARDRAPDAESLLLSLSTESSQDMRWLAANNLLFERKSRPWYSNVLERLTITHRFTVVDPNTGIGIGGSSLCGMCGGIPVPHVFNGFPPITLYTLTASSVTGDTLLAKGPEDVYYRRVEFQSDAPIRSDSPCGSVDRQRTRMGYLAMLAGEDRASVEPLIQRRTTIPFSSIASFTQQVSAALQTQIDGIRVLLKVIEDRGLPALPGLRLSITPQVDDVRSSPAPLPAVGTREFTLK